MIRELKFVENINKLSLKHYDEVEGKIKTVDKTVDTIVKKCK